MRLSRHLKDAARDRVPGVVTVGNFDGVHLGHQRIFERVGAIASAQGLRPTAVIFEPQPQEFFRPGSMARLTSFHEKLECLRTQPLAQVLCLRFDASFAAMPARDFVRRVLVETLDVRHLLVGDDFRFGAGRQGDLDLLQELAQSDGFVVERAPSVEWAGLRISSTRVREALARGALAEATACLGRPYRLSGRVVRGDQRGRALGAPTANIALRGRKLPLAGVFAAYVHGAAGTPVPAVANAGVRPTVDGTRPSLEVHLLDFSQDLYGRRLSVEFAVRLREERRFDSLTQLKHQIGLDLEAARDWFATGPREDHGKRTRL